MKEFLKSKILTFFKEIQAWKYISVIVPDSQGSLNGYFSENVKAFPQIKIIQRHFSIEIMGWKEKKIL